MENLTKLIALSGLFSRRTAESLIRAGSVQVNGKKAIIGQKASSTDEIKINGKVIDLNVKKRLIAFNKPVNYITSHNDEKDRPTIFKILPKEFANFHYIGRLDFKSAGLLLLTNDPALKLQYEKGDQIRGYKVKTEGKITPALLQPLEKGITIDGFHYKGIKSEIIETGATGSWLKVYLTEGKNREIRRIFEYLGHPVKELIRFSYGKYQLKNLKAGQIREEIFPK
jgi:23S rRNA pseudouridine2605 synthase